MLTTVLNALALVRFGGFRLGHGGGDGFVWLLLGLFFIGLLVWALNRHGQSESSKG